ncbi:MAG: MFS transporter [Burkholderia sp.]|nr:MFS transporter [Burkholderia sp.]
MTKHELRATIFLSWIFMLRMLGLFMIMPVFSVYAETINGGNNVVLVGMALGAYGVAQSLLYIFYGLASDRFGRKPVITVGLLIFSFGSFISACANHITWIIVGRIVQGMGAVSSAVLAFIADVTSEKNRTKAMAIVGGSIGVSFAVAIVCTPIMFQWIGMSGLFALIGALSMLSIAVLIWMVPDPGKREYTPKSFREVLYDTNLHRLNFSVLTLHATQTALFLVVPRLLVDFGLPVISHWKVYFPIIGLSFIMIVPAIIIAEKHGKIKLFLLVGISAILISQLLLSTVSYNMLTIITILFIYFLGFNLLEAIQPSIVSKIASSSSKGMAIGVYNTTQSIGLALGGIVGGYLLKHGGHNILFLSCSVLVLFSLISAIRIKLLRVE